MPRVELRDYRKARTPFGSLLRLFRYFRHCRTIMICAVASILVYVAATIAASYCMKPLVNLLKQTGLAPSEVYAKYLALVHAGSHCQGEGLRRQQNQASGSG